MRFDRLTDYVHDLDEFVRFRDFAAGRTADGFLDRRFKIRRHTLAALVLPAAACFFAVLATPNLPRLAWALVTAVVVFLLLWWRMYAYSKNQRPLTRDLYLQLAVVSLTVIVIWRFGDRQYSDLYPYQNLLLPLTLAVIVALLAASVVSRTLFKSLLPDSNFGQSLSRTELFADRGETLPITGSGLLLAVFLVPFRSPLQLLLPPAIAALLAPPVWLNASVLAAFAVCYAALTFSSLNERFGMMWSLLNQALLHGGALLISLVLIALAAGRYMGITYVTTIFDTAAGWVVSTVLLSVYVLSWWFSYWMNRLLSDQLIHLIDPGCASGEVSIPYEIAEGVKATSVPADHRVLQLHGSARFIVIRDTKGQNAIPYFQSYSALDLFSALSLVGAPGGKAAPTLLQLTGRTFTFHGLVTALLALILIGAGLAISGGKQDAELVADLSKTQGISLQALLAKPADDHTIYVIAASGGGTRAALFTTAILEGIASRGKASAVVLGSGVSGGGAALAYFAGFRSSLVQYDQEAWRKYYEAMKAAYIRDVLERASEWRMVGEGRLGMLLRESFERRWGLSEPASALDRCPSAASESDGCQFGLILNTTLAGQLNLTGKVPQGRLLAALEPEHRRETGSTVAGGRLILTNLALRSGFAGDAVEPDDPRLPVVVRSPTATLQHAAALNANFPPVFANAAIDVDNQQRYWVTDGGAADNRGLEMMLYALRKGLQDRSPDQLPRLHIIVADAGAYSNEYGQDRGISSSMGGGAHFASALDSALKSSLETIYRERKDRLGFTYVYMPRPLRASGSFGTHWMLQSSITVHRTHEITTIKDWFRSWGKSDPNPTVTITGEEMVDVLRSLYNRQPRSLDPVDRAGGQPLKLSPKACTVLEWARGESSGEHSRDNWVKAMTALGDSSPDVTPPACP